MGKIDWHKPIRAMDGTEAKPFNSHGSRVVWIGDYVYPVDEQGRAKASVYYPRAEGRSCSVGERLVENVPEEPKDHLGVYWTGYKWVIDTVGFGDNVAMMTETEAKDWARRGAAQRRQAVKVPV